jgi:anti-sigma regulatory factor (Ser/Thr protein kinase)
MPPMSTGSVRLAPTAGASDTARRFLRGQMRTWALDGLGGVTELLTSELVTNVVQHVGSPMTVRISCDASIVRVEVDDDSAEPPVLTHADPSSEHGRGLMLVNALASDWGTVGTANGKTVWFELDTHTAANEIRSSD